MTITADLVPGPAVLEEWVRLATLAPSVLNTQPWLFRVGADCVDVLADDSRRLATDVRGREQHISLGAAVCNLRVAIAGRAFRPVIRWLPDPADPDLVATVRAVGTYRVTSHDRSLRGAINNRRSNLLPFSPRPLDSTVARALEVATAAEGATLQIMDRRDHTGPTIAVLATEGDGRADWLRAGVALERVLLEATTAGIATACESVSPETSVLQKLDGDVTPGTTQLVLRLGYAPPGGPSPRRPVHQVLISSR